MQGAVLLLSADLPIYNFLKEALSRENNLGTYVDALIQLKPMWQVGLQPETFSNAWDSGLNM